MNAGTKLQDLRYRGPVVVSRYNRIKVHSRAIPSLLEEQPGLSWRARTQRQRALAVVPVRYNKSSVIRQYGPIFATAHGASSTTAVPAVVAS